MKFPADYHVLITAGPTREAIDPVRFISNRSSGRLGYALAREARNKGARVTLISGPTALKPPRGVKCVRVTTACEMHHAALRHARSADLIICAAAVADWRPRVVQQRKIKKGVGRPLVSLAGTWDAVLSHVPRPTSHIFLELIHNPDILATLCKRRSRGQFIVGFALESEDLLANATKKLHQKKCDCIVANKVGAIGANIHRAILIFKNGKRIKLPPLPKGALARRLLALLLPRFGNDRVQGQHRRG